jgi:hypothetical protein
VKRGKCEEGPRNGAECLASGAGGRRPVWRPGTQVWPSLVYSPSALTAPLQSGGSCFTQNCAIKRGLVQANAACLHQKIKSSAASRSSSRASHSGRPWTTTMCGREVALGTWSAQPHGRTPWLRPPPPGRTKRGERARASAARKSRVGRPHALSACSAASTCASTLNASLKASITWGSVGVVLEGMQWSRSACGGSDRFFHTTLPLLRTPLHTLPHLTFPLLSITYVWRPGSRPMRSAGIPNVLRRIEPWSVRSG